MGVKAFWLEDTNRVRRSLRTYENGPVPCGADCSYHNGMIGLDEVDSVKDADGYNMNRADWDMTDPRFPTKCDRCSWIFTEKATKQLFIESLFICKADGRIMTLRESPPGAMWNAFWLVHQPNSPWAGPDGMSIVAKCPDGREWTIDGRASNCTMPTDNIHKCWVRHGIPPNLTVDKNGATCQAGAGSIQTGKWHGFLRNGEFVEC